MEDTELLVTRSPDDGETALLISSDSLHRDNLMGHLYFELDFGDGCVVTAIDFYLAEKLPGTGFPQHGKSQFLPDEE